MLVQCIWCGLRCYSTALLFCVLSGPIKNMNLKSLSGIQREHSHYVLESSHRALQSDCCTLHSNSTPRNSCINARIYVEFLWQIIFLKKCLNKEKRTNKFKSGPVFFFYTAQICLYHDTLYSRIVVAFHIRLGISYVVLNQIYIWFLSMQWLCQNQNICGFVSMSMFTSLLHHY